jgi:hypothetical protein
MPEAEQAPAAETRHFILTTVWQGLSELADRINAESDRIATVTVDPADRGRVSLRVYPVGSQPAQAPPLFRYGVAVSSVASGSRVQFVAQPAVVNGQLLSGEQGELVMTTPSERQPRTSQDVRGEVARRYQAVISTQTAHDAGCCAYPVPCTKSVRSYRPTQPPNPLASSGNSSPSRVPRAPLRTAANVCGVSAAVIASSA